MNGSQTSWRRLRLVALVLVASGSAFALVLLISTYTSRHPGTGQQPAGTRTQPGAASPVAQSNLYAAVDPALIPALEAAYLHDRPGPLEVITTDIPPIGIYLPATGDSQFKLLLPTITPAPKPTLAPLPTNTPTAAAISTYRAFPPPATPSDDTTPTPSGVVVTVPTLAPPAGPTFGGLDCAPAGWPAPGPLTQVFHRWHSGIDIGVPLDTPVVATHSGQVIFAGWRTDGYGNLVIIQNGPFITYYAHLNSFNVIPGQVVARLTVIGWSGSTGNSTGPHIHYETRIDDIPVDPLTFEERGHPSC
ncbi:MAG: peptidoglycan DD-metalloendopeptidase family protein [Anaerolineae bacterium]|nr:peptidoglycan DD-metalloendopeptidase family protein [Anaerolineae bacterium]